MELSKHQIANAKFKAYRTSKRVKEWRRKYDKIRRIKLIYFEALFSLLLMNKITEYFFYVLQKDRILR